MVVSRDLNGEIRVTVSRDELMNLLQKWREKPETKQLIARLNAERREYIEKIMAGIRVRQK